MRTSMKETPYASRCCDRMFSSRTLRLCGFVLVPESFGAVSA
ncbi:MAG: hypothetical protein ACI4RV_03770 [Eubacteriales bacterium]